MTFSTDATGAGISQVAKKITPPTIATNSDIISIL